MFTVNSNPNVPRGTKQRLTLKPIKEWAKKNNCDFKTARVFSCVDKLGVHYSFDRFDTGYNLPLVLSTLHALHIHVVTIQMVCDMESEGDIMCQYIDFYINDILNN